MNIICWNVNGFRAVIKKDFFKWFNREKPDILCIQETKIQEDQLTEEMRNVEGYYSYWASAKKKGYSGVGLYSKEKPIKVKIGFGNKFDKEGRVIIAEYKKFTLYNLYFPNGKMSPARLKYKMDFNNYLLKRVRNSKKKIIITGDINTAHQEIDIARPKENSKISGFLPEEREWITKLLKAGFVDTFRHQHPKKVKYTWWSMRTAARKRNVGWRLDYFIISKNLKFKKSDMLSNVHGSDHCPIILKL